MSDPRRSPLAYTDYPMSVLGDPPSEQAPVRPVIVLMYDTDKYVKVLVQPGKNAGAFVFELKAGYVYSERARYEDAPDRFPVEEFGVDMETYLSLKAVEG